MPGWRCFMIQPAEFCRLSLQRFAYSKNTIGDTNVGFKTIEKPCPKGKDYGHDASVVIAEQVQAQNERSIGKKEYEEDPRWPAKCAACDYVFVDDDQWQVNHDRLWKGSPDGKLYLLRETPPGATWIADWLTDSEWAKERFAGPDGKAWCVMLPGGVEWIVYGPSTITDGSGKRNLNGPKWTVEGTPPNITVSPSIHNIGFYHGFIKNGAVTSDCDGRVFPQWPYTA